MQLNLFFLYIMVSIKPYRDSRVQKIETINEISCLLIIYFFLCFTGLVEDGEIVTVFMIDAKARDQIGLILISLTLTNFLIDFVPILFDVKVAIKKKCHKRKVRKLLRQRSQTKEKYRENVKHEVA